MKRFLSGAVFVAVCFSMAQSKSWRGITPLHSTCANVREILNVEKCAFPMSEYALPDYKVVVFFSESGGCSKDPKAWRVPKGTVTSIVVSPQKEMKPVEFGIDVSTYRKLGQGDVLGTEGYENRDDGVEVHLFKGFVDYVVFFPDKSEEGNRCKSMGKSKTGTRKSRKSKTGTRPEICAILIRKS